MEDFLPALTSVAAVGCGVVAGVFFVFSAFVMKALGRLPTSQAIGAMQAINAAAPSPAFMAVLFGTALACAAVMLCSVFVWGESLAVYLLAGGALYLICSIGPTAVYHVPRNEALAKVEPCGADAGNRWSRYLAGWTTWNHLRFAGALAASGALTIALHIS